MRLPVNQFAGINQKVSPRLLREIASVYARNARLDTGDLRPFNDDLAVLTLSKAGTIHSIFLYEDLYWFHWTQEVDVIKGPISDDIHKRVYWTGEAPYPRYTTFDVALSGGGTDYPINSWRLGVPAPTVAPTVSLSPRETPTQFTFTDQSGTAKNVYVESNAVTITGITTPARIRVVGGEYAIGAGGFTALEGTISNGQTVKVRHYTSGRDGTRSHTQLIVGYTYDTFTSITTGGVSGDQPTEPQPPDFEKENRVYVYTYVTAYGEEGPPSPASNNLEIAPDVAYASVADMAVAPAGPYNITAKRIYRSVTGTSDTEFFFVGEVVIATTSLVDTTDPDDFGELLITSNWDPPPDDMHSLIVLPNGIVAGASGKDLCVSEAFMPHAWPPEYRQPVDEEIVGLGYFDTTIVVLTKGHPQVAQGVAPSAISLEKMPISQSCVSKRSIQTLLGVGVVYASPDGLIGIGPRGFQNLSDEEFTREQWRAFTPSSMRGAVHDGRYYAFYDTGAIQGAVVYDPSLPQGMRFVVLDYWAHAAWQDVETDKLYLVKTNNLLRSWEDGAGFLTYLWRSKLFITPQPCNFGWCQIRAEAYASITFRFYAKNEAGALVLKHTQVVTSEEPFPLPDAYRSTDWYFELEGTSRVRDIQISETLEELV